ncbi:SCAN domain-containing protein 3-like [Palaemon carinicauda]|uniref:SCAN domain-containing protein 3-like n=1 Tax=Palaemon carinicauda TaxID=392227 RepID=UPI0035B5ACD9
MRERVISSVEKNKKFAIQLDEITDASSNSQLMVYIQSRDSDEMEKEILLCSLLKLRTHGNDVFYKADVYFKRQKVDLKWDDCILVSVEGDPYKFGPVRGFVALTKERDPNIQVIHCMIHRQTLFVMNLEPEVEAMLNDAEPELSYDYRLDLGSKLELSGMDFGK